MLLISILGFLFLVAVMLLGINSGCIITPVSAEMRDYILDSNTITDVNNFLANYNSLLPTFRGHSTTKPPGTLLFFYFMNKITNVIVNITLDSIAIRFGISFEYGTRPVGIIFTGVIMSLIGVMSIISLYYVGQKIYDEKVGMCSCLSLLFVPSVVLFTPTIDQMYMFIAITSFLLFVYGLRARKKMRHIFFLSSGFLLSLGLFMNFGLFPMVVFNLLFYMVHTRRCKLKTRVRVPSELVFFFFGLSLLFYLIYLFYNLNIIETLLVTKKAHEIITGQRSYLIWVFFNLYDFFIFLGIPLSMLFLRKTYYIALSIKKKSIICLLYTSPSPRDRG